MNLTNIIIKNWRLITIIITIIFVLIIMMLLSTTALPEPNIIASYPINNSTNIDLDEHILVTFDQNISETPLTVLGKPEDIFTISQSSEVTATISPSQPLLPNTKYTVQISDNNKLDYSLSFTTIALNTDPRTLQQIHNNLADNYPLADLTPHENPSMRVVYSAPMTLEITLKSSTLSEQDAISQTKSWVSKNGGDPTAHSYQVTISPSTPPPASPAN